jgi:uncharacterized protein (DUF2236 family)
MTKAVLNMPSPGHIPAAPVQGKAARGQGSAKPRKAMPKVDFTAPAGAPALYAPDSVGWHVFKNPVSLFVGGIAAVLLELGEPRVRSGVWGHSIFPTDPVTRMRRTGMATHVSVYAPAKLAEKLIGGVVRMHEKVRGETPAGVPYHANDPVLLDWVQCTVGFGFMEAYAAFCRPLTSAQKDRFYREMVPSANLFLSMNPPLSVSEQQAQFAAMEPHLEAHPIVFEFLDIMKRTPAVPGMLKPLQWMMVRAGIAILPDWVRARLALDGPELALKGWERRLVRSMGALFERIPIPGTPPVQASKRLGLPGNYLYRHGPAA